MHARGLVCNSAEDLRIGSELQCHVRSAGGTGVYQGVGKDHIAAVAGHAVEFLLLPELNELDLHQDAGQIHQVSAGCLKVNLRNEEFPGHLRPCALPQLFVQVDDLFWHNSIVLGDDLKSSLGIFLRECSSSDAGRCISEGIVCDAGDLIEWKDGLDAEADSVAETEVVVATECAELDLRRPVS